MDKDIMEHMFDNTTKLYVNMQELSSDLIIKNKQVDKLVFNKNKLIEEYTYKVKKTQNQEQIVSEQQLKRSKYKVLLNGFSGDSIIDIDTMGIDIDGNEDFIKVLNNVKETEDNTLGIKFKQVYYIPNHVGSVVSPISKMYIPVSGLKGSDFSQTYDKYVGANNNVIHSQFIYNVFVRMSNTLKVTNHNLIGHYGETEFDYTKNIMWKSKQNITLDTNKSNNFNVTGFQPGSVPRMGIEYFDEYNKWRTYVLYEPNTKNNKSQYEFMTKLTEWITTKPDEESVQFSSLVDFYGDNRYTDTTNDPRSYKLDKVLPYYNTISMYNFRSIGMIKASDILTNNIYKDINLVQFTSSFQEVADKIISFNASADMDKVVYETMDEAKSRMHIPDGTPIRELGSTQWEVNEEHEYLYDEQKDNDPKGNQTAIDRLKKLFANKYMIDNTGNKVSYADVISPVKLRLSTDNKYWELQTSKLVKTPEVCDLDIDPSKAPPFNCVPNPEPMYDNMDLNNALALEYGIDSSDSRITIYDYGDMKVGLVSDKETYLIHKGTKFYRLNKLVSEHYRVMRAYLLDVVKNTGVMLKVGTNDLTSFKFAQTDNIFGPTITNVIKETNNSTIGYDFQMYELSEGKLDVLLNVFIKHVNDLYVYNVLIDGDAIYNLIDQHNPLHDLHSPYSEEFLLATDIIVKAKHKLDKKLLTILQPMINFEDLLDIEKHISQLNSTLGVNTPTIFTKNTFNNHISIKLGDKPIEYTLTLPNYPITDMTLPIDESHIDGYISILDGDYGNVCDEYENKLIGYKPIRTHVDLTWEQLAPVKQVTDTRKEWVTKVRRVKLISDENSSMIESKESAALRLGIPMGKLRLNKNYIESGNLVTDVIDYIKPNINSILQLDGYLNTFSIKSETGEINTIISTINGVDRAFLVDVNNVFNKDSEEFTTLCTIFYVDSNSNKCILNLYTELLDNPIKVKNDIDEYIKHNRNMEYQTLIISALNSIVKVDISDKLQSNINDLSDLVTINIPISMIMNDGTIDNDQQLLMKVNVNVISNNNRRMAWEQYIDKKTREENLYEFIMRFNKMIGKFNPKGIETYDDYMTRLTDSNFSGDIIRYEDLSDFIANSQLDVITNTKVMHRDVYDICILTADAKINSIIIKHENSKIAYVYYYDYEVTDIEAILADIDKIELSDMHTITVGGHDLVSNIVDLSDTTGIKIFSDDTKNTNIISIAKYNTLDDNSNIKQDDGKWVLFQEVVNTNAKAYDINLNSKIIMEYDRIVLDDVKDVLIKNIYKYAGDVLMNNLPQSVNDALLNTTILDLYPAKSKNLETLNGLNEILHNTPFIITSNAMTDIHNPLKVIDVNYELNQTVSDDITKWRTDLFSNYGTSIPYATGISRKYSFAEYGGNFMMSYEPYDTTNTSVSETGQIDNITDTPLVFDNANTVSNMTIPYDAVSLSETERQLEFFYESMFEEDDNILLDIINKQKSKLIRCWYLPQVNDYSNIRNAKNIYMSSNLSKVYLDNNDDFYNNILLVYRNDLLTPPEVFEHRYDRYVKSSFKWFRDPNDMNMWYLTYDPKKHHDAKYNQLDIIKFTMGKVYVQSNIIQDIIIDDIDMSERISTVKPIYMEFNDNNELTNIPDSNINNDLVSFCMDLVKGNTDVIDIENSLIKMNETNINSLNEIFSHTKATDFSYYKSDVSEEHAGELDRFDANIKPLVIANNNKGLNTTDIKSEVKVYSKINMDNSLFNQKVINTFDLLQKEMLINQVYKNTNGNYISNYAVCKYNDLSTHGIFLDYSKSATYMSDIYQYMKISPDRYNQYTTSNFTFNTNNTMSHELAYIDKGYLFHPSNLETISVLGTITPYNNNPNSKSLTDDLIYSTFSFGLDYYNRTNVVNNPWTRRYEGHYIYNKGRDNLEVLNTTLSFPLLKLYDNPSKYHKQVRLISTMYTGTVSNKSYKYSENESYDKLESLVNYEYNPNDDIAGEAHRTSKAVLAINSKEDPEFRFFEETSTNIPVWTDGMYKTIDIDFIFNYDNIVVKNSVLSNIMMMITETENAIKNDSLIITENNGNKRCAMTLPFKFVDNTLKYDQEKAISIVNMLLVFIKQDSTIKSYFAPIYEALLGRIINNSIIEMDLLLIMAQLPELKYFTTKFANSTYTFSPVDFSNEFVVNFFDNLVQIVDNDIYELSIFDNVYIPPEYLYAHRYNWTGLRTIKNTKNKVKKQYLNYSYITYNDKMYPNLGYDGIYNCEKNNTFIECIYNDA